MFLYYIMQIFRYKWRILSMLILEKIQLVHHFHKRSRSILMMIGHNNSAGQYIIIRMDSRHRCTLFSGQFIDFCSRNIIINLVNYFHYKGSIVDFYVCFVSKCSDSFKNFIKRNDFFTAITLCNQHFFVFVHVTGSIVSNIRHFSEYSMNIQYIKNICLYTFYKSIVVLTY